MARRRALHVRRREVHGRRDQQSRLQPREHRRLRPHPLGRHAGSAHGGRPLQGGVRAVRHPVHPRHAAEARARGTRHRPGAGLQPQPARHRAIPGGRMEGRRIRPARAGAALLARRRVPEDPTADVQVHAEHQHAHQPAEERRGARRRRSCRGTSCASWRDPVDRRSQDARQRLRARDAEREAVPAICGRARQARAHPRASIASSSRKPSSMVSRPLSTARSSRCRGRTRTNHAVYRLRSGSRARLLDEAGWTRRARRHPRRGTAARSRSR